jgi:hypothetical protein
VRGRLSDSRSNLPGERKNMFLSGDPSRSGCSGNVNFDDKINYEEECNVENSDSEITEAEIVAYRKAIICHYVRPCTHFGPYQIYYSASRVLSSGNNPDRLRLQIIR